MHAFEDAFVDVVDAPPGDLATIRPTIHPHAKELLIRAGEVMLAAERQHDEVLAREIADLLRQVQTVMILRGLKPEDVYHFL